MNERESICADIIDEGLVAIVRVPRTELALPLATALVAGGIRAVELTMTIPNALDAIREIDREMGNDILLGVGTVIDDDTCQVAIDAGAKYVISPVTKPSLVEAAHALDRPVMLGAYTHRGTNSPRGRLRFYQDFPGRHAWPGLHQGTARTADAPAYHPHRRCQPRHNGVVPAAGSAALGIGSSLLNKDIIESENWPELERLAKQHADKLAELKTNWAADRLAKGFTASTGFDTQSAVTETQSIGFIGAGKMAAALAKAW